MKASDLMIDDWVYCHQPECKGHRIDYIHEADEEVGADGEIYSIDDIDPIPLTPEILEKNGMKPFEIDKLTSKATAKWWHKSGDFFIKQYHFKHHNFEPSYSFGCNNHTLIEGIEYVHELQHALKLCKIEKEIKL